MDGQDWIEGDVLSHLAGNVAFHLAHPADLLAVGLQMAAPVASAGGMGLPEPAAPASARARAAAGLRRVSVVSALQAASGGAGLPHVNAAQITSRARLKAPRIFRTVSRLS